MAEVIRYSYKHAPTLWRFAKSDAFVRGLLGPWRCLVGDTEFLTPQGWKRLDAYQPGDLVAQWDHRDGTTTFVPPIAYIKEPSEGFVKIHSGSLIMEVTENHRVPHYDTKGRFQVLTVQQIIENPSRRIIPTTFKPNDRPGIAMSDDLIRFATMMHGDGCYPPGHSQAWVGVMKERKKQRIRQILSAVNVTWRERNSKARPAETVFTFDPPYRGKRFTGDWWKATPEQLAVVVDEMRHWDGCVDNERLLYTSANRNDADFIQYASHACGNRASISHRKDFRPGRKGYYVVSIRRGAKNIATVRANAKITRIAATDGLQYCFNVPTGFFVARCKGSIFITGNSGKSSACVVEILRRAQEQAPGPDGIRRTRWMVVRNVRKDLTDTTIPTFMRWCPEAHFGVFNKTSLSYHIKGLPGCDIEVWFRALDSEDDIKHLLSLELTGAWFNEAREIPWPIIKHMMGRVRQYPSREMGGVTWGGLILDTNPGDTTSDWYKFFEERKHTPGFAEIFKQPSGLSAEAENLPFINDGRAYYERLAQDADQDWINVYIHGYYGFLKEGRAVFPEYADGLHCKEINPVPGIPIHRGLDWGLQPACAFSQLLPDNRWLIFDELISEDMSVDHFLDIVQDHSLRSFKRRVEFIDTGDPAGNIRSEVDARSVFMMAAAKGMNIQPGIQSPKIRIESVRRPLRRIVMGQPQFILHPRCTTLRKAMLGGYHYKKLKVSGDRYAEKPDKNNFSHVTEGMCYTATRLFALELMTQKDGRERAEDDYTEYDNATRSRHTGY